MNKFVSRLFYWWSKTESNCLHADFKKAVNLKNYLNQKFGISAILQISVVYINNNP